MSEKLFSQQLLAWFDQHGRKNLPWQQPATPYRVWLSEVMLQQTQVSTVIPYFQRFVVRFPDIRSLAEASTDEVLQYWAGLGYYARGRNLHKAAVIMAQQHNAAIPENFDALLALPGIGRSTAGAIMALAFQHRYPILDGNVKRVLCRFTAEPDWPGQKNIETALWQLAESLLPERRINAYIQAQMDLGATVCTRSKPDCHCCPLQTNCLGRQTGKPEHYPVRKKKPALPERHCRWLIYRQSEKILLEKRPEKGIWGGMWSFPEINIDMPMDAILARHAVDDMIDLTPIRHTFTHFRLQIIPLLIDINQHDQIETNDNQQWVTITDSLSLALPAPVNKLIQKLNRGVT
ncbi:A/G-specific adenine glycosylase [Methylophaga frappieri]|uniref:Adenine DNA glycosylase n=1 Tax=Methylophaga frappieri (strain ATCC BAA-2434 / DSM 25690 / JAM7) TaxID=754477 RepID=I1YGB8_METFJ|nr:A/G-specific adenine glycosylase [Methylophaga frappieri]AFJ01961.1 A/G-specific adenine glycosylase [Methylophaga frappieri]